MKKLLLYAVVALSAAIAGCASIEGTRDKSATIARTPSPISIDSIAILPIKDYAAVEGLSQQIEVALPQGLVKSFPSARVVDTQTFASNLGSAGLLQAYGQWASNYESTSVVDPKPVPSFAKAGNVHYLLLVRSLYLNREKINATAAGYSGTVSDANNVWRTDLKASAVLIDANSGVVVWRGAGHAENISSKKRDIDLGLVIINKRSPEISDYLAQLVQTLADGLGSQIAGRSPNG
ncbi:MAG: hypothetical protein OSA97_06040 [Nevskia sp.]|nr:hypothetical protein [Nevskia sp.]